MLQHGIGSPDSISVKTACGTPVTIQNADSTAKDLTAHQQLSKIHAKLHADCVVRFPHGVVIERLDRLFSTRTAATGKHQLLGAFQMDGYSIAIHETLTGRDLEILEGRSIAAQRRHKSFSTGRMRSIRTGNEFNFLWTVNVAG